MTPAGSSRSFAISALVTVAFWVGGCSPAGLPLLPQDRQVRTGRETADAAGSAARAVTSSDKQRALYESNLEEQSSDEAPDESAETTGPESKERESDKPESSGSDPSSGAQSPRPSAPPLQVVERDGDTYEFVAGEGDSTRPESPERRLLRAVVAAHSAAETPNAPREGATGDVGTSPSNRSDATGRGVLLHRLVIGASKFDVYGASPSRQQLEAFLARLRDQQAIESVEVAQPPSTGDASDAEFQLSGTHSHD